MTRVIVVFLAVFVSATLAQAKTIVVGSHGGTLSLLNFFNGDEYEPFSTHAEFDNPRHDSEWLGNQDNHKEDEEFTAHGIDASIIYLREKTTGTIYATISQDTANPMTAYYFVDGVYEEGDLVFLVGYSAGSDFVIRLAKLLANADYPVHILGLIDPIIDLDSIYIPSSVKKVAVYYQEEDPLFQGFHSFILAGEASYFPNHPKLITDTDHKAVLYEEEVWKNLGIKMVDKSDGFLENQYIESFESYSVGDLDGQNDWTASGFKTISDERAYSGTKSIHSYRSAWNGDSDVASLANKTFDDLDSTDDTVSFWYYPVNISTGTNVCNLSTAVNLNTSMERFGVRPTSSTSGAFVIDHPGNCSSGLTVGTVEEGNWYFVEIQFDFENHFYKARLNGGSWSLNRCISSTSSYITKFNDDLYSRSQEYFIDNVSIAPFGIVD